MKKKFLAMLLAVVLAVGLLPGTAWAADSDFVIENGVLTEYIGPGSQAQIDLGISIRGGDIIIPNGVTEIGKSAFFACMASSITIPDGVTTIGARAFVYSDVSNINIPNSVTQIGESAFYHCDLLNSVTIPGSVTIIAGGAFQQCYGLTSVTICDGVAEIGEYAFWDSSNLTNVIIPDSVTSIGAEAFFNCTSLKDVYYGGSESQWEQISIDLSPPYVDDTVENGNAPLLSATIHYNSTGPVTFLYRAYA